MKQIVVVVQKGGNVSRENKDEYKVELKSPIDGQSDLQLLIESLTQKSGFLHSNVTAGQVSFKKQSIFRAGKWVTLGENSPIKEKVLSCALY